MFASHFLDDHRREAAALVQQFTHALVVLALLRAEVQRIGRLFRHHDEQGGVDDVRALAQDLALRAFLPAAGDEGADVEKVANGGVAGQGLAGRKVDAVTRKHIADLALRHRHHRVDVHAELQRRKEVETTAFKFGLEAGFAVHGQEAGLHRATAAPQLFDHADAVVRDVPDDTCNADGQGQQGKDDQACQQGQAHGKEVARHEGLHPMRCKCSTAVVLLAASGRHKDLRSPSAGGVSQSCNQGAGSRSTASKRSR